jgi:hypothetical protein
VGRDKAWMKEKWEKKEGEKNKKLKKIQEKNKKLKKRIRNPGKEWKIQKRMCI